MSTVRLKIVVGLAANVQSAAARVGRPLLIPVHETGFCAVGIILRAFQEARLQPADEEAMFIAGLVVDTIGIGAVVDRVRHSGCDEVVHRVCGRQRSAHSAAACAACKSCTTDCRNGREE